MSLTGVLLLEVMAAAIGVAAGRYAATRSPVLAGMVVFGVLVWTLALVGSTT